MPRRKSPASTSTSQANSWALVPADGAPIREKARREYKRVLRELERARREIERFEKEDQPLYNQWMHRQFGVLLAELRETSQKLQEKRDLLLEVDSEAFLSGCSHLRAYQRIVKRRANPAADEWEGPHEDKFDPFEFSGQGADHQPPPPPPLPERRPPPKAAGLKALYRALARRLHPDAQESMTPQKKEWWHQAQVAYETGDVEQLQVILTLCEIEAEGTTTKTSVSLLTRIIKEFKSSLRALKSKLKQYRREPSWQFSQLDEPIALRTQIERTLRYNLSAMTFELRAIELQLQAWAAHAQKARREPVRRRKPSGLDFLF